VITLLAGKHRTQVGEAFLVILFRSRVTGSLSEECFVFLGELLEMLVAISVRILFGRIEASKYGSMLAAFISSFLPGIDLRLLESEIFAPQEILIPLEGWYVAPKPT
jgi:hypothetical protein